MENSTIPKLLSDAFAMNLAKNNSHVIVGIYDAKLVDAVWVLVTALVIFTMQTGFALVEAGIVSKKNRVNVMIKNVIDVCFGGLTFWAIGFGFAYGRGQYTAPFLGLGDFFVNESVDNPLMPQLLLFYFLQASFSTTSATIFSAAIAERVKITAYILLSCGITLNYAIAAGWIWGEHGFLRNMGVIDYAGAGPIHIIGGTSAFLGAWYIGPRIGRFDKGSLPAPMNDPLLACAGLFILWWGWIGKILNIQEFRTHKLR
jgi:ammonium transporter, Amt family